MIQDYYESTFSFDDKDSGYDDGENFYSAKSLYDQAHKEGMETFEFDLMSGYYPERWNGIDCVSMAEHYHRINNADINIPIILSSCGRILDGFHRITKAIIEHSKIRAIRLKDMPEPTRKS